MYNRFSQRERLRSDFIPQEFIPNFELLAQALSTQQNRYDQVLEASGKLPQFIRESDMARQQALQIKADQEAGMEVINEAYRTGGIQAGNAARKKFLTELKQSYSPGGRANRLENDYNLYQAYREELQGNENITKDVRDAALKRSLGNYEANFDTGNPFSGYQTQDYVDVQSKLDKLADGFEKEVREGTAIMNGRRLYKDFNGQYYVMENDKIEYVDYGEVRDFVMNMAFTDPEIQAFYRQEDDLFGGTFEYQTVDEEGNPVSIPMGRGMYSINTIADALADKYSFMQQTTKFNVKENWVAKQNRKFAHEKKMKEEDDYGHRASLLLRQDTGLTKIDPRAWKQKVILDEKSQERFDELKRINLLVPHSMTKEQREELRAFYDADKGRVKEYSDEEREQQARQFYDWLSKPEGLSKYPSMRGYVDKVPLRDADNNPIPLEERLEIAAERYNQVLDDVNTRVMRGTVIEGDKRERHNAVMFGGPSSGGDLQDYTLIPYDNTSHELGAATNLKTILDENDITEEQWKEVKKNFTVSKELDPDSPGIPGGILITGFLPNDKGENIEVRFIAKQPSVESENYYNQYSGLYKSDVNPFKDHGYGVGFGEPRVITSPDGEDREVMIYVEPVFNAENPNEYEGMEKRVFEYNRQTGEKIPSNLSFNELSEYISQRNPLRNY